MGGAGGAAAPPTFQQEGLSPPNVHMLSLLFNVEPPQLLNHSYAYGEYNYTLTVYIYYHVILLVVMFSGGVVPNTVRNSYSCPSRCGKLN